MRLKIIQKTGFKKVFTEGCLSTTLNVLLLGMEIQKHVAFQNIEAAYSGDLTFWELMILGKLLPSIRLADSDFCPYTIPLNDFIATQVIENERVSDAVYKAASQLLERRIIWTYLDANGEMRQCQTTLLTSVDVLMSNNVLSLDVMIHPRLKPLILSFKSEKHTYDFLQLPFLKVCMSHRLYLLLLQNINQNLNSFTINLEKLKALLGISDKYTLYANLKIKILEEAQKRLLYDADIPFDFGEIKTGKKVTVIRFRIDRHLLLPTLENEPNEGSNANVPLAHHLPTPIQVEAPVLAVENTINTDLNKDLIQKISKKFGVTQRMLKKLAEDFSEQSLQQAVLLTEKAIEKKTIKGSPAGFFVEAVRQNYQATEEDEQAKRQAEARQKAERLAQIEAEQRQQREAFKKQEFEQERDEILEELSRNVILQQTISERIRYSIFHASFDITKTFEENLQNPSFVAAVLNFYKIIKK